MNTVTLHPSGLYDQTASIRATLNSTTALTGTASFGPKSVSTNTTAIPLAASSGTNELYSVNISAQGNTFNSLYFRSGIPPMWAPGPTLIGSIAGNRIYGTNDGSLDSSANIADGAYTGGTLNILRRDENGDTLSPDLNITRFFNKRWMRFGTFGGDGTTSFEWHIENDEKRDTNRWIGVSVLDSGGLSTPVIQGNQPFYVPATFVDPTTTESSPTGVTIVGDGSAETNITAVTVTPLANGESGFTWSVTGGPSNATYQLWMSDHDPADPEFDPGYNAAYLEVDGDISGYAPGDVIFFRNRILDRNFRTHKGHDRNQVSFGDWPYDTRNSDLRSGDPGMLVTMEPDTLGEFGNTGLYTRTVKSADFSLSYRIFMGGGTMQGSRTIPDLNREITIKMPFRTSSAATLNCRLSISGITNDDVEITSINGVAQPAGTFFPQPIPVSPTVSEIDIRVRFLVEDTSSGFNFISLDLPQGTFDSGPVNAFYSDTTEMALTAGFFGKYEDFTRVSGSPSRKVGIRDHATIKTQPNSYGMADLLVYDTPMIDRHRELLAVTDTFFFQYDAHFSVADLNRMFEYLFVPAGLGSEFADLRAAGGQTLPILDAFALLILENFNEPWNTGNPAFYNFPQNMVDHTDGSTLSAGAALGAHWNAVLKIWRANPFHSQTNFESRLAAGTLALYAGGQIGLDYGQETALECPDLSIVGANNYIGGWEGGLGGTADDIPIEYYRKLHWPGTVNVARLNVFDGRTQVVNAARGPGEFTLINAIYEDGLSFSDTNNIPEGESRFARSLAGAAVLLSNMIHEAKIGIPHRYYFQFGPGPKWQTHTQFAVNRGQDPIGQTLACALLNAFCIGTIHDFDLGLVARRTVEVRAGDIYLDVPEIEAHRIDTGDGAQTVQILNRNLDYTLIDPGDGIFSITGDQPSISDDGQRTVDLVLPFSSATAITKYEIVSDFTGNAYKFDAHNWVNPGEHANAANIQIQETEITGWSGGPLTQTIQPGIATVFRFEGVA